MSNVPSKRRQSVLEASVSDSEVSFNLTAKDNKRQRLTNMGSTENGNASGDIVAQLKLHFDQKAEEMHLKYSLQLAPLQNQVTSNSENIVEIQKTLARIESRATSAANPSALKRKDFLMDQKKEKFYLSRRSGRFWSIEGSESELLGASVLFLQNILRIPESENVALKIESVRRTRTAYSSKIKNEVLIVFDSPSTRDFVFSHGKNLAGESKESGKPTNGMRIDYPAHLGSDYRALDSYGARLRKEAGTGFRRNIRFNDDEMGIYMDIKFPDQEKWIRVTPRMAKANRGETTIKGEEEAMSRIRESLFVWIRDTDWR